MRTIKMKRKTKEISSTARPLEQKAPTIKAISIILTVDQFKSVEKLASVDSHKDAGEWAKKQILRIVADRSREIN
tara:strand:- start:946 stop:1170 length:225 start_codon:yes stop_codon:yes gene_type:complete